MFDHIAEESLFDVSRIVLMDRKCSLSPGSVGQPFLDRSSNNQLGIPNDDPSCSPWIPTDLSRRVDILEQTRGARPGVASQSIRSLRSVDSMKDLENGMPSPPTIPDGEQMTPRSSGKAGSSRGVSDQTASVGVPVYVMLPLDTVIPAED